MVKKLFRFLLFLLALTITVYGVARLWPQIQKSTQNIYTKVPNIQISSIQSKLVSQLKNWTETDLLNKINSYRSLSKLAPLTINSKLSSAANSRLAVLVEFGDFEGSQTGVTREKALENVGYKYSWVGDLNLLDFFKSNDPIKYWQSDKNSAATLNDKNLKEVGISMKQSAELVDVYIVLATPAKPVAKVSAKPTANWSGPDLWKVINRRRLESGVNPLKQRDDLCTIASIRLNQLLELGKLDGHAGFEPTLNRPDLKYISEQLNVSEFLVYGYKTPEESVAAWENTLGHKKLIIGGEYVWGCVYAQNTFGVAIAAY